MLRLEEEMDRITRNQTFGMFVAATRILVLLAVLGSLAEARQPPNASALLGTWVNVKNTGISVLITLTTLLAILPLPVQLAAQHARNTNLVHLPCLGTLKHEYRQIVRPAFELVRTS